ncbi:MAG: folylpolyglutamate synthase [Rickettsiaceae bacterium]|jgi:dihydrofolate synthase/folylpolyglutamate synthase|nr:folylpolyglutamate synthase [Rickettsiaceae bacterium]
MKFPFWPNPIGYRNIDLGLERVYHLLERLGNPHKKLPPTIHIAGTNGKGSTLSYLKAIFEDAGLKAHCYTSPHLVNFNERIILAGNEINDDFLNDVLRECKKAAEQEPEIKITFFEGITVAAFLAFSRIKADILLLETGMGGRLDATNVVEHPLATIITSISKDHTEFLGKTLAKIAYEKAGIIKANSPVICSKQKSSALKVLQEVAKKNNSEFFGFGDIWNAKKQKDKMVFSFQKYEITLPFPALVGDHQIINAGNAIAAIFAQNKFKISQENIENGLQKAVWKARLQNITEGNFYEILPKNFQLILDGGHNEDGAKSISNWLKKNREIKTYLICAMLKDKDSRSFLKHLSKQTEMLVGIEIKDEEKSKTADEIATIAKSLDIESRTATGILPAIEIIKKYHAKNYQNQSAKIIVCGSLYLAGQFLKENKDLLHNSSGLPRQG